MQTFVTVFNRVGIVRRIFAVEAHQGYALLRRLDRMGYSFHAFTGPAESI